MKTDRIKIGVDIDGVLIDSDIPDFLNFCRQELGWNVNYELFSQTHSWFDATGQTSPEIMGQAFERFIIEVEESQKPIEGAHDALKQIGKEADIYLITARVGKMLQVTETFLQTHLSDVNYHEISMDNADKKAERIIDFNLDFYIDDSYREITKILEQKSVNSTIIPFPAFHGRPTWHDIQDTRIHWLSIWQDMQHEMYLEQQADIRRKAWQEISSLVV